MRYGAETELRPGQVFRRAREYFIDRVGLTLSDDSLLHVRFVGGGGYVLLTARRRGPRTHLELEVFELDREAQEFLASLPAPSPVGRLRQWWGARRRPDA